MTYYSGWIIQNKNLFVYDSKGDKHFFSPAIKVTRKFRDIDNGSYYLEIKFLAHSQVESIIIERKLLADEFLTSLLARGFWLSATLINKVTLSEILMEQENHLPVEFCHSKLGFHTINGETYYLGQEEISGKLNSTYVGKMPLSSSGAYCQWQNFVSQIIEENPLISLPLAMGVSAPIVTRLKIAGVTDETALWAIIGVSSSGKTSCLRLSASAWSMPSGDGIIDNLTGTEKYFFASLANREGYPNFFDETSAVTWGFTKAIYTVALSREGGRCNTDGTPKERKTWSGAVIFTGETSMFNRTNGNGGLHARLVEFDFSWFKNEKQPETITRFVSRNYGTAWLHLISYLQTIDDENLCARYDASTIELRKAIAFRNGFTEENWEDKKVVGIQIRIIKKLAVLLLSCYIMAEAWGLHIPKDKLIAYLLETYDLNSSRIDKFEEFHESFVQYIASHRDEFPTVNTTGYDISKLLSAKGFQDRYKGKNCVWVLAETFNKQLQKHGLDSSPNILNELHKRNIIEHFGDRYKKNYRTGNIKPACFCFYPDTSSVSSQIIAKNTKKNKKRSSQLQNLLAD